MRKTLKVGFKLLITLVVVGFACFISTYPAYQILLAITLIFLLSNTALLLTPNHRQAAKNLRSFFKSLREEGRSVLIWIFT